MISALAVLCALAIQGQPESATPAPPIEPDFVALFDGTTLKGWVGDPTGYAVENGTIVSQTKPTTLLTEGVYGDFELRLEFKLATGANNGIGIRAPRDGDPAYVGMEVQVLDNSAKEYATLKPWQYHGSIYGVVPAKRDFLKPLGEWNVQTIIAKGGHIQVILNGTVIVDADITECARDGTVDGKDHPGLRRQSGHIGLLGHGEGVAYRNIRIKEIR